MPKAATPTEPFAARLAAHRRLIRDRIHQRLESRRQVLFQGEAMSADEARSRYRAMERRQIGRLIELLVLVAALGGFVALAWKAVQGLPG